jgi:FAD:protein FMN transferase
VPAEQSFTAMGTTGRVVVLSGSATLARRAVDRIADLERRWSRFRPDSEVSRLNARAGHGPVVVSPDTAALVAHAVRAWELTAGTFDPTVLAAVVANGYDRPFPALPVDRADERHAPTAAPGCAGIRVDRSIPTVALPCGVALDPGGIGKGLAADLVAEEVLAGGADGVLVDIGGDIRVAGCGPAGGGWVIDVDHPTLPDRRILHVVVRDAGIATSSRLRRRWRIGGADRHHLVDPRTGRCLTTPLVAVTVLAGRAWWAEAVTKQILVTGDLTRATAASVITVDEAGTIRTTPDLTEAAA